MILKPIKNKLFLKAKQGYQSVWAPDGESLFIVGDFDNTSFSSIYKVEMENGFPMKRLTLDDERGEMVSSVSADGRALFYVSHPSIHTENVRFMTLPLTGPNALTPYPGIPEYALTPALSPDGKWLAYVAIDSVEAPYTKSRQLFLRSLQGDGRHYKVTNSGGFSPVWSHDGTELFYLSGDTLKNIMAVSVHSDSKPVVGDPELLFSHRFQVITAAEWWAIYCVSNDGQRFIFVQNERQSNATKVHVVLNWFEELKEKMAAARDSRLQAGLMN